jgi:hypothetical protein
MRIGVRVAVLLGASLFALQQPGFAAVTAETVRLYMQTMDPSNLTYRVPKGKVFILQHVGFSTSWTQSRVLHIVPPGGTKFASTVELTFGKSFNTLDRPLKLPAETAVLSVNSMTNEECILFGVLADDTDLYAAIGSELNNPRLAEGFLCADLVLDSPRPALVTAESTVQLHPSSWREERGALTATADRRIHEVRIDPGVSGTKFLRASARARQADD